jgi:hypothetical protein
MRTLLLASLLFWHFHSHEHGVVKIGEDGTAHVFLHRGYKNGPSCVAAGAQIKIIRSGKKYRFYLFGGKAGQLVNWDCK